MIDYLYYRFYRLWLHSSLAEGAVFMGMSYVLGHTEYQRIDRMGMLTRYGIVAYPPIFSIILSRGRHYCLVELAVLFSKRYDRISM